MEYHNPNDYWMPDMSRLTNEEQEEVRRITMLYGCGLNIICVIVLLVLLLLMSGCATTKYVPVIEQKTDTLIQIKVQHDSIHVHDSTSVIQNGDTVLIERWHTQLVKKEVHDTTYISKTDTVPKPYPVPEYVEKQLTWWQRTRMYAGDVMLVLLTGLLGFGVFKVIRIFR